MPQRHFCLWGSSGVKTIVGRLTLDEAREALTQLVALFGSDHQDIERQHSRPSANYGWADIRGERIEILAQDE